MKIPGSIRRLYDNQLQTNTPLKERVDQRIRGLKREVWHYESRLKVPQSFALKLESGRFVKPEALEDFFASTLVVRNGNEISQAEELIRNHFRPIERRPTSDGRTHKRPEQFPFDDLRLYVQWRDDPDLPPSGLTSITFEVQIKTFLQHAWAIATHDLVYKSDTVSWSKRRIAFQIKAMLEHAEVSIQEAERIAESTALAKTDPPTENLQEYIAVLTSRWARADLPDDIQRLAENIASIMEVAELRPEALRQGLDNEKAKGRGPLTTNLSPYGIVLQTLMYEYPTHFRKAVTARKRKRVLISAELPLPSTLDRGACKNAIFIE